MFNRVVCAIVSKGCETKAWTPGPLSRFALLRLDVVVLNLCVYMLRKYMERVYIYIFFFFCCVGAKMNKTF